MMLSLPKENKKMYSDLKRDIMCITQCDVVPLFHKIFNELVYKIACGEQGKF